MVGLSKCSLLYNWITFPLSSVEAVYLSAGEDEATPIAKGPRLLDRVRRGPSSLSLSLNALKNRVVER